MATPTIRLLRLGLKAFRSYVDKQELMLPDHGLHLIDAPSGHGKSGLAESVAFAFDYSQFAGTEHQSWPWLTEEPMEVELDFLVGTTESTIRRGKKPMLKVGDRKALTAASVISKTLPDVLGIKPEMLQALTYRPQRQRGLLLSMGDTEKKGFFTELLHMGATEAEVERTQKNITKLEHDIELYTGLAEHVAKRVPPVPSRPVMEDLTCLQAKAETAQAAAAAARKQLGEQNSRIDALRAEQQHQAMVVSERWLPALSQAQVEVDEAQRLTYKPSEETKSLLAKADLDIAQASQLTYSVDTELQTQLAKAHRDIELQKGQGFEADPNVAQKLAKLNNRVRLIRDGMSKLRAEHRAKIDKARAEHDSLQQALWGDEQKALELPKLKAKRAGLAADILELANETCPTCKQEWQSAYEAREEKELEAAELDTRIANGEKFVATLNQRHADVSDLHANLKTMMDQDPVPQKFYDGEREQQAALGALQHEQQGAAKQFEAEKSARMAQLTAVYQGLRQAEQAERQKFDVQHQAKLAELRTALRILQQQADMVRQQFEAVKSTKIAEAKAKLSEVQTRRADSLREAQASVDEKLRDEGDTGRLYQLVRDAEAEAVQAEVAVRATNVSNVNLERNYSAEVARYDEAKAEADAETAKVTAAVAQMHAEEDFWALMKSFLNLVFDETLQCIAARANELIVGVPNVAGLTLDFASERETKSGTVRQEIKLLVRKDGHEIPFRSGCSGGQQAVVELAVDLALAEVIAERTGVYPGWLVLDEPFDGLGAADKEGCMEVLSRVAEDRAIFVIDHSTETKSAFDSVISVKYADGRSTLSFAA